jgi:hypothetical protein
MAANRRTDGAAVNRLPENSAARHAAQQSQVRDDRRRQAETRAEQLLAEARASGSNTVVRHTLYLLTQALSVDHVTFRIGPETGPHAVFCASRRAASSVSSSDGTGADGTGAFDPHASSPVDGASSRLHAFLYDAGHPEPRGCLSVHSIQARSFSVTEVALVHALAALLAREAELGQPTPRRHDAATSARRVHPTNV